MSDERDDLLDEIGAALNVEPSPAFAVRVREAVERQTPRVRWAGWAWAVGVFAAATVLVIAVVRTPTAVREVGPGSAVASTAGPGAAGGEPSVASIGIARGEASLVRPRAKQVVRTPRVEPGLVLGAVALPTALEVIVPAEEMRALRQLVAAAAEGRAQPGPYEVATDPETGALLPPKEIVIPPIAAALPINVEPGSGGRN